MKTRILIACLAIAIGSTAKAQNIKIGYTNAEYVLSLLPEAKQIEADLSAYEKQLQNQLQSKYQELQTKVADYQQNEASYNDLIKADKQREINTMQESLQEFQTNAESSMLKKRNDLLKPAVEKIGNAIKEVAEANGYSHILSSGSPGVDILLYASEDYDVTNLILAKLGIDAPTGN
ncbi:MAG: OmpH family outer membrane protein [Cyclobacteriaceae bacterium]|nr:OmpH family outer membrane protein [Cyclobacteriaceae bacterium HetDA_MAG_MS6]